MRGTRAPVPSGTVVLVTVVCENRMKRAGLGDTLRNSVFETARAKTMLPSLCPHSALSRGPTSRGCSSFPSEQHTGWLKVKRQGARCQQGPGRPRGSQCECCCLECVSCVATCFFRVPKIALSLNGRLTGKHAASLNASYRPCPTPSPVSLLKSKGWKT